MLAAAAVARLRRKSRRSTVCTPVSASVDDPRLPGGILLLGLCDRRFRQCFGLSRLIDPAVEVAGGGGVLGRSQSLLSGGPLILQRARVLLGGLCSRDRSIEVRLRACSLNR